MGGCKEEDNMTCTTLGWRYACMYKYERIISVTWWSIAISRKSRAI